MNVQQRPDTATVARQLLDKGWNPLPLPAGKKTPPPEGYTGYRGKTVTAADVNTWDWSGNIAIRMPDGVIGIDVDGYKGGDLPALAETIGVELPPTTWSTSKKDGSGIAFFRVPAGTTLQANPAEAIEIIQTGHRYAVTWPSIHPSGDLYEWVDEIELEALTEPPDIDDLAELPFQWIEHLRAIKTATAPSAAPQAVNAFITANNSATAPGRLKGVQRRLDDYSGSRHDTLVEVACWAMREVAAGCYTATDAINVLHAWWVRVMDDAERLDGNEFGVCIAWATAQASLDSVRVAEIRADVAKHNGETVPDVTTLGTAPAGDQDGTGELEADEGGFNLPDLFWKTRPALAHIRQAAHARNRGAEAVLIATLARVSALVPPNVVLPAIVGNEASLNFFTAIVGRSGGGKTTAVAIARRLIPIDRKDIVDPLLPGSGEGLIDAYFELVSEQSPDTGKKVLVKRKTKTSAYVVVDEGQSLLSQKDRSGSTIMETMRSAWSGSALGQANASQETRRFMDDFTYRMSMVMGFQLKYAADLIGDAEGGTPQRFVFVPAVDPTIPETRTPWPGALGWTPPDTVTGGFVEISVDDDVADGIYRRDLAKARGEEEPHELNSHADLVREKVAALLGILDQRLEINDVDWQLAGMIMERSNRVRTWAINTAREAASQEAEQRINAAVKRESKLADEAEERAVAGGARAIARRCHKDGETVTRRDLTLAVSSKHRAHSSIEDMLDRALAMGWVRAVEGGFTEGESRPK